MATTAAVLLRSTTTSAVYRRGVSTALSSSSRFYVGNRFFASSSPDVFEINDMNDFKTKVLQADKPTILDCYAK